MTKRIAKKEDMVDALLKILSDGTAHGVLVVVKTNNGIKINGYLPTVGDAAERNVLGVLTGVAGLAVRAALDDPGVTIRELLGGEIGTATVDDVEQE